MPITCKHTIRPLSQQEFGDIAYEVMRHVFAVHRELGRLFDEEINPQDLLAKPQFRATDDRLLGMRGVPQIAPETAIRVTSVAEENLPAFEHHLSQFFRHTSLHILQWVNLTRQVVQFKTIT